MMRDSQNAAILDHLKRNGSITPLEALNWYGCMRLGARIWDLKRAGAPIETRWEIRRNAAGKYKRYARYLLMKETA